MSETYRSTIETGDTGSGSYRSSYSESTGTNYDQDKGGEAGKALLAGLLGGLLSAAGYMVYQRLPEDQKERLQSQAKQILAQRFNDIRQNFNF